MQEAQVEAMDVDPLDSNVSDTARIAYGNSSGVGRTGINALSAMHHDRFHDVPDLLTALFHLLSMTGNCTGGYIFFP